MSRSHDPEGPMRLTLKMKSNRQNIVSFFQNLFPFAVNRRTILAWSLSFIICLVVILVNAKPGYDFARNTEEFEAGKVADRDVTADRDLSYEDEEATRVRMDEQEQFVPAVFHYSGKITEELQKSWDRFSALAGKNPETGDSPDAFTLAVQSEYPGDFPAGVLDLLYESRDRQAVLSECGTVLKTVLEKGIYSVPRNGLEHLNSDVAELIRQTGSRIEQERILLRNITTDRGINEAVAAAVDSLSCSLLTKQLAPQLLEPFLKVNVFYSPEDTIQRIMEARSKTEKVMRTIEQGKRIIKKGFVITEEEMTELRVLSMTRFESNLSLIFADLIFLLLLFGFLGFFNGSRVVGRNLKVRETYLVSGLTALYIAGSVLVRDVPVKFMPASVMIPTALVIMLPAILIHSRLALMLAMALPLGAFLTGSFDAPSFVFALASGVVAAYSLHGAEKRMDLVKAGLFIAAANLAAVVAVLLWQRSPAGVYPSSLFWAAFNGLASAMLVLGVLPPLENALNAATTFRLIELSDLNTPILRRLFTTAPGSYSHSIMVANLSESACQDIGANPLLARVGAYYHDLGKMENPDYFVENQTDYNRHDDMAPRLSATVIRSHVKLGVEKARQLKLPQEVIDIISEHHGNSVITWFYDKALKLEDGSENAVNKEDFSYPGNPPRSRESAVVMLADVAEAATRTLIKPTAVKIEKFIQELIVKKVESGQLAESELTFRDLETIKNAFVRILAGYYHSRIEYPKNTGEAGESNGSGHK